MRTVLFLISILVLAQGASAQNSWGPVTRPITRIHASLAPGSVGFENNLMNHISDLLRLDTDEINKPISCQGDQSGIVVHRKGGRVIPIQCYGAEQLQYIRQQVSTFYGEGMGMHLKYAFRSGPYIFAVCNYDEKTDHRHHDGHYVCRTPVQGASLNGNLETYCYEMGLFHRTCNPHKALVSAEIIPINSRRRWSSIDKEILVRHLEAESERQGRAEIKEFAKSMSGSTVLYSNNSRGAPTSDLRYPKVFSNSGVVCIESHSGSDERYVRTSISCGRGRSQRVGRGKYQTSLQDVQFQTELVRLKQELTDYPLLAPEKSNVGQ